MKNSFWARTIVGVLLVIAMIIFIVTCLDEKDNFYQNEILETDECEKSSKSIVCEKKGITYILNTDSKKIHKVTCGTGALMLPENRMVYQGNIEDLYSQGYTKCGNCFK